MATSSLIRLVVVVVILFALAMTSGLAWGTLAGPGDVSAVETIQFSLW